MKGALAALALSYAIFFDLLVSTGRGLPLRLASHFDFAGRANGWMDRENYLVFTIGVAVGLPLFMLAITLMAGRAPGMVNIPNRDYWLAPERRRDTVALLLRYVVGLCSIVVLLVTGIHLLVVVANEDPAHPQMNQVATWTLLSAALLAIGVWCLRLRRRFALPN